MASTSTETPPIPTRFKLSKPLRQYLQFNSPVYHGALAYSKAAKDEAYDYKVGLHEFEPETVFSEVRALHTKLSAILQEQLTPQQEKSLEDYILNCLVGMVYGSNMIEHAGSSFDATHNLCSVVFCGKQSSENKPVKSKKVYLDLEEHLSLNNLPESPLDVLRSFHEVFGHAKAASYIIHQLCICGQGLTEEIILKTHEILTHKIDADGTPWEEYSGVYRTDEVSAGLHQFPHHSLVPYKMKAMIRELKSDLKQALSDGDIDPVTIASKYSHQFVNIHPFIDGNGRMSRLILNSLLLKLGSFLVCIGEDQVDRDLYLQVAANGSGLEETYGDLDEDERPVMHKELGSFVLSHLKKSMDKPVHTLQS